MQQTILILHILSAVVLWSFSFYALVSVRNNVRYSQLKKKFQTLLSLLLLSAGLGILTAISFGTLSVIVCAKIGLYSLPALVSMSVVKVKLGTALGESREINT